MSTRSEALRWLRSHYGAVSDPICTSKYYEAHESWTKTPVWWFQIPVRHIQEGHAMYIHLLGQDAYSGHDYHYLKVPTAYFRDQFSQLGFTNENQINLHLSAQTANMFDDERGKGKISFSRFLMV